MTKQEAMDKILEMYFAEGNKAKAYCNVAAECRSKYFSLSDVIEKEHELNGASDEYWRLKEEQGEVLKKANDNHENAQNCFAAASAYFNVYQIIREVA